MKLIKNKTIDKFDRWVWSVILGLIIAIGVILYHGNAVATAVKDFSWLNRKIGVRDTVFRLDFNRPVAQKDVENNLTINPPLKGKVSWANNQLVYTLTELPIYGKKYQLNVGGLDTAFQGTFYSHDRAFAYIGVNDKERGKLILCNIIQGPDNVTELRKTALTPGDIIVTNFKIYPAGDKILFSAFEPVSGTQETPKQQLYTVTTGLNHSNERENQPSGRIERILDTSVYQNLKFDLAGNGKTIVVERINFSNPADAGLWVIDETGKARNLGIGGGSFLLSPDGNRVAVGQQSGIALIPLNESGGKPQFFANYNQILDFSRDGSQKLLVKNNIDGSRSLDIINNDNEAKTLLRNNNPITACEFEPREEKTLYCLKINTPRALTKETEAIPANPREEPFLSMIDITTGIETPLLALPNYRDVQMSMSPDGVALLFDQLVTTPYGLKQDLVTGEGLTIADGRLWLLPLPEGVDKETLSNILPEELNQGFKPLWLP
ncbi:MAG: hypothetical protein N5P05_002474 [Chroococcopsis gigantea SAG 12.99]|jgi:hypothetical protein|nr:hypothetical protein [Chroococcopsis gigantea SAG 12.99]